MARGSQSKEVITQKILETFAGAFLNDKEIRIPMLEDGSEVQIKVTLTAAKENIEHSGAADGFNPAFETESAFPTSVKKEPIKATDEEKAAVAEMMSALGF